MNKIIEIKVEDKVASLVDNSQFVVCGNTDYEIHFEFSEEWQNDSVKTALFVFADTAVERVFVGDICEGVEIVNASLCRIGVYTGNVKTTTPACLNCRKSITDAAGGKVHTDPSEDIYNQIIEVVNQGFAKIDDFEQDIDGLLTDVDGLKRDVSTQGNSINNLQMDVSDIYAQLVGIRDDISQNSQGIKDINQTIGWMSSDIGSNSYAIGQNSLKISQNTKDIAEQTKRNDITDIRLANLEHHINPEYFYTDDSVAYQKVVPVGAAPYAQLNSVGGMTYKSKNLANINAITPNIYVRVEDSKILVTTIPTSAGVASTVRLKELCPNLKAGDTCFLSYTTTGTDERTYLFESKTTWKNNTSLTITQEMLDSVVYFYASGSSTSAVISNFMINLGTTALPYEPYYEGLRDAKVTTIRNHGANLIDDEAIFLQNGLVKQSNGYWKGQGINIKPFVNTEQRKGAVTISFSARSVNAVAPAASPIVIRFAYLGESNQYPVAVTSASYQTYTFTTDNAKVVDNMGLGYGDFGEIEIKDLIISWGEKVDYTPYHAPTEHAIPTAITSLDGWGKGIEGYANTYDFENGTYTKYTNDGETLLQEPIITKVSTGFDPLIRVEGGGSLEFVNEYSYDAPSSITYLLQEGSV